MDYFNTTIFTDLNELFEQIALTVTNTPILELFYDHKGKSSSIFVKCENKNIARNIEYRIALFTLRRAYKQYRIMPGDIILVPFWDNYGAAYAAIGRAIGHKVIIVMPESAEKQCMEHLSSFNAELHLVSQEMEDSLGCVRLSEQMGKSSKNFFLPHLFENQYVNETQQHKIGKEIWTQLSAKQIFPDAFVVGKRKSCNGIGRYLQAMNPEIQLYNPEVTFSAHSSTAVHDTNHNLGKPRKKKSLHIARGDDNEGIVSVEDREALDISQKITNELGLNIGILSAANLLAAIKVKEVLGENANVVTIFCDSAASDCASKVEMKVDKVNSSKAPNLTFRNYEKVANDNSFIKI
jgi:cysteine synthase A